MKTILCLMLCACATTSLDYGNPEGSCPRPMTDDQQRSGSVQCRAECASWGRNMVEFDKDCRCVCTPQHGQHSTYVPNAEHQS